MTSPPQSGDVTGRLLTDAGRASPTEETAAQAGATPPAWPGGEAWRASEASTRAVIESTSVAIAQADPHTRRLLQVNAAMCALTGYERAELLGMRSGDLTHPDDRERDAALRLRLLRGEAGSYEIEKRYVRRDGAVVWVSVTGDMVRDESGQPLRLVAVIHDITRRKLDERLMHEQSLLLERIAAGEPLEDCLLALTAAVSRLNDSTRAAVLLADETRGHFERAFAAEVPPTFGRGIERAPICELAIGTCGAAVHSGESVTCTDIRDDPRWAPPWRELCLAHGIRACHSEPVRDVARHAIGSLMLCFDQARAPSDWERRIARFGAQVASIVLERDRADRALRDSEARCRSIVEGATGFAILTLDEAGRIASWNSGAERMMGYAAADVLGRPGEIFFLPADVERGEPAREMAIARAEGRAENERWHLRADGSRFWASGQIMPLPGGGFLKIFHDRTAARTAELGRQQLLEAERSARADAEVANRLKDEFLATLSHELRTPLANVVSWGRVLQKQHAGGDPTLVRGLGVIVDNALAQSRMIADLLDMSRIVAGKVQLARRSVDLRELVEGSVLGYRPAADARGIALSVALPPEPLRARVDPVRIQQVLWNLLSNALKFTPDGGHIEVALQADGPWATLTVRDSGAGIDPAFLPHVFDRFRQGEGGAARRYGGLGLGLAIVRQLAALHGGTAEAASAGLGEGACFTVRLPQAEAEEAADAPLADAPEASDAAGATTSRGDPKRTGAAARPLRDLRILVVEDDPSMLDVVSRVLRDTGAEVTAVASAQDALRALRDAGPGHYRLLVSDLGLPRVDGLQLIREIREFSPAGELPAVAVTAFARAEDRSRAFAAGFQAYLTKPYEMPRLIALLRRLAADADRAA